MRRNVVLSLSCCSALVFFFSPFLSLGTWRGTINKKNQNQTLFTIELSAASEVTTVNDGVISDNPRECLGILGLMAVGFGFFACVTILISLCLVLQKKHIARFILVHSIAVGFVEFFVPVSQIMSLCDIPQDVKYKGDAQLQSSSMGIGPILTLLGVIGMIIVSFMAFFWEDDVFVNAQGDEEARVRLPSNQELIQLNMMMNPQYQQPVLWEEQPERLEPEV
eukprot:PhF_6_TR5717/c0_g1_i2/m.8424